MSTEQPPGPHGNGYRKGPVLLRGGQVPRTTSDQRLLASGNEPDWVHGDPWRVMRIQSEFVEGFGALDELFESLTLVQTHKVTGFPIVLIGRDYWKGLLGWMRSTVVPRGNIHAPDLDLIQLVDDPAEAGHLVCERDAELQAEEEAAVAANAAAEQEAERASNRR